MNITKLLSALGLLMIVVTMLSCRSTTKYITIEDVEVPNVSYQGLSDSAIRVITLRHMTDQLAHYPSLDAGAVGYGGVETEQYRRFKSLESFATENELIQLTSHQSGIVKAYAFWALRNRNSKACKKILNQHLDDQTKFLEFAGCLISDTYVNISFLQSLYDKLSQEEINSYRQKINHVLGSKAPMVY